MDRNLASRDGPRPAVESSTQTATRQEIPETDEATGESRGLQWVVVVSIVPSWNENS